MRPPDSDQVDHPAHYGGADDPFEVIKVLRAWRAPAEYAGFLRGNVVKYVARAPRKGGQEDYRKAEWYLRELIRFESEREEGK